MSSLGEIFLRQEDYGQAPSESSSLLLMWDVRQLNSRLSNTSLCALIHVEPINPVGDGRGRRSDCGHKKQVVFMIFFSPLLGWPVSSVFWPLSFCRYRSASHCTARCSRAFYRLRPRLPSPSRPDFGRKRLGSVSLSVSRGRRGRWRSCSFGCLDDIRQYLTQSSVAWAEFKELLWVGSCSILPLNRVKSTVTPANQRNRRAPRPIDK